MAVNIVEHSGYTNCIEISNAHTKIVIDPNFGGRVLEYSLNNRNIIRTSPDEDGFIHSGNKDLPHWLSPHGGRCDIGPEMTIPPHPVLWTGRWEYEISGELSLTLISQPDEATGVRLYREFILEKDTSKVWFTQSIKNISGELKEYCHWGRTFVIGGGICLVPLNPKSRYPFGYLLYGPGDVMDYKTVEDKNISVREGILEITGPPERAKFAIDACEGWIAYIAKNDLLFTKKFPIYPKRIYGEMAANSVSIWYNRDEMVEIEPIGPMESIEPGKSVSFSEEWNLYEFEYPDNKIVNLQELKTKLI